MRTRLIRGLALAAILTLAGACDRTPDVDAAGPVRVTDARIRAVPPGQENTAAYFNLENRGQTPFIIAGAESAQARAIEIHVIERDGDMLHMRRLPQVVVEPGATVRFEPEGLHLMVFGITPPAEPFVATLVGGDGTRIAVPFRTIPLGGN